ncbi:hypothetical protein H6P81_014835 [Aristolochia fimbriata]|uniref:Uncharacterized protein n=1 Tax=Aristolochia fimbriata TaxID=158543 RepID=A0AAV7E3J6_ARIFI|nr:hypothetical protein H6P81_014835 [Aristolochia fimbriata]
MGPFLAGPLTSRATRCQHASYQVPRGQVTGRTRTGPRRLESEFADVARKKRRNHLIGRSQRIPVTPSGFPFPGQPSRSRREKPGISVLLFINYSMTDVSLFHWPECPPFLSFLRSYAGPTLGLTTTSSGPVESSSELFLQWVPQSWRRKGRRFTTLRHHQRHLLDPPEITPPPPRSPSPSWVARRSPSPTPLLSPSLSKGKLELYEENILGGRTKETRVFGSLRNENVPRRGRSWRVRRRHVPPAVRTRPTPVPRGRETGRDSPDSYRNSPTWYPKNVVTPRSAPRRTRIRDHSYAVRIPDTRPTVARVTCKHVGNRYSTWQFCAGTKRAFSVLVFIYYGMTQVFFTLAGSSAFSPSLVLSGTHSRTHDPQ